MSEQIVLLALMDNFYFCKKLPPLTFCNLRVKLQLYPGNIRMLYYNQTAMVQNEAYYLSLKRVDYMSNKTYSCE
jgi:hypothetical protein